MWNKSIKERIVIWRVCYIEVLWQDHLYNCNGKQSQVPALHWNGLEEQKDGRKHEKVKLHLRGVVLADDVIRVTVRCPWRGVQQRWTQEVGTAHLLTGGPNYLKIRTSILGRQISCCKSDSVQSRWRIFTARPHEYNGPINVAQDHYDTLRLRHLSGNIETKGSCGLYGWG